MNSMLTDTTTDGHIATLETAFQLAETPVQWLVISHDDQRMINSLASAFKGESAAMLPLSQDMWEFTSRQFTETVEWALQRDEVENLVLAGSSQVAGRMSDVPSTGSCDNHDSSIVARVQRHNARSQAMQEAFAKQIQQLSLIPIVHSRWRSGMLGIYGLYFRAECGVFMQYDVKKEAFSPLLR